MDNKIRAAINNLDQDLGILLCLMHDGTISKDESVLRILKIFRSFVAELANEDEERSNQKYITIKDENAETYIGQYLCKLHIDKQIRRGLYEYEEAYYCEKTGCWEHADFKAK